MQAGWLAEKQTIRKLRVEWGAYALLSVLFLAGGFWLLRAGWSGLYAGLWLLIAGGMAMQLFLFLWQHLDDNRSQAAGGNLFASLGPANQVTIARAVLTGALAGFLPGPWPQGWLAWVPGGLYLLVAVLDFVDGFLARVTGRTTRLGELLDMKWDGAGVLIGAALAVRYEQAPVWFLLVALARFIFLLGEWLLRRRGVTLFELDPSMVRRALAGMQMGFIGVVLLPVFTPPATQVASTLFMLPFLIHFTRDFLWVSGRIGPQAGGRQSGSRWKGQVWAWLPIGLRLSQVLLLALMLAEQARAGFSMPGVTVIAALALPAIMIGVTGRLVALVVLLMTGFALQTSPLHWLYWAVLLNSTLLFIIGTGRFSLWKPEEWLIHHRAGEARQ
jgi:CDP-diacylglycerol---glycerol-3-phosphate 3-phosphatidyltransferase